MWFGKYGLKHDALKAVERGRAAFDLHAENCAFPGSQEEFGEIHRIEPRIDFTGGLRLGNARSKRSTPFLKYCLQPLAPEVALRALRLKSPIRQPRFHLSSASTPLIIMSRYRCSRCRGLRDLSSRASLTNPLR